MKDLEIREELHKNHLSHYKYDPNSKVIDELGLCQGSIKIDIAVINGSLIGYEIKSEQDTLDRLPAQMDMYNKIFDYINIVVNESHLESVRKMIPSYWGIVCVKKLQDDFKLETRRAAKKNTHSDSFHISQLLWKEEALDVLKRENLDKGMKTKTRIQIWNKLAESLSKENINAYVREYIKKRQDWR